MWGALIFLLMFLVIDPATRDFIVAGLEQARLRVAVEAPISYFLLVVLGGSATISALIMALWPKPESERQHHRVIHRYFGAAECDLRPLARRTGAKTRLMLDCARFVWPLSLPSVAGRKRDRALAGFAGLKRLLGV